MQGKEKVKNGYTLKGVVHYEARNAKGEKIRDAIEENVITNAGLDEVTNLLGNVSTPTAFTYLATGSDNTAAAAGQTALISENTTNGSARAAATVTQETNTVTNDTLQLVHTWNFTGSITVAEVGVFNAASVGIMLARQVPTSKAFANGDSLQVTYQITVS